MYNKDPPLPVQKLIKYVEPYKGDSMQGKRIEQSWITLSTAAKMLERMQANQKRYYQHQRATHKFQVGDLVLIKKHNADKMDLRWEPDYRVIRVMSPWSAVVENQISSKTKCCKVGDLKPKHTSEDWEIKPSPIARAVRFINHLDMIPSHDMTVCSDPKGNVGTRYNLRKSMKAPTRLEL